MSRCACRSGDPSTVRRDLAPGMAEAMQAWNEEHGVKGVGVRNGRQEVLTGIRANVEPRWLGEAFREDPENFGRTDRHLRSVA